MQGPWTVETACLGMRHFNPSDEAELWEIAQNSEFMRAVHEALQERGAIEPLAQRWADSGTPTPVGVVLKATSQVIGVFAALPLSNESGRPGIEGVFVLNSKQYDQGYASEMIQASREAIRKEYETRNQGKPVPHRPAFNLQGSIAKQAYGATVLGFKFTVAATA